MKKIFFLSLVAACANCHDKPKDPPVPTAVNLQITQCVTDKGLYQSGESINLSFQLKNTATAAAHVNSVVVRIAQLDNATSFLQDINILGATDIDAQGTKTITNTSIWTVPSTASAGSAFGVYVGYTTDASTSTINYQTFFRVASSGMLTTYAINQATYNGLPVNMLDGGLSAEYAVEKSAEVLTSGISHSWKVSQPGQGPNPVYSTPQFLEKSVNQTVNFYNSTLGSSTTFETVVIGTGIPSAPYLAGTMKAPFLPLHFLAGVGTIKEVESILDYSNQNNLSAYATVGYDASIQVGVSWINLLDIPQAYLTFLSQHNVKNVVMLGYTGTQNGENTAKMVSRTTGNSSYAPGSVYIMYPNGGTAQDVSALSAKLNDYGSTTTTGQYITIADWESGITQSQLTNFSQHIKSGTSAGVEQLSSDNDIALWDLATYVMLHFFNKNELQVNGISLNPYLLGNPFYEMRFGFIPFAYWQGNASSTTTSRILGTTAPAFSNYFPGINFSQLTLWLNSSNNFGGGQNAGALQTALKSSGFNNFKTNSYAVDEVWNSSDGMNSPCELRAVEMLGTYSAANLATWNQSLTPLTVHDLEQIASKFTLITAKGL